MLDIHDLPSSVSISVTYFTFINGTRQLGATINKAVFQEQSGLLDNSFIGIKYNMYISKSQLATRPKLSDLIVVGSRSFKIVTVLDKSYSPNIAPYWSLEIKSTMN